MKKIINKFWASDPAETAMYGLFLFILTPLLFIMLPLYLVGLFAKPILLFCGFIDDDKKPNYIAKYGPGR